MTQRGHALASADSLAWSYDARRRPPLPGHTHKNCANCQPYALTWRTRVLNSLPPSQQPTLKAACPTHNRHPNYRKPRHIHDQYPR